MPPLLEVRGLTLGFSGLIALDDVSFDVNEGELLAIIGPNGAGKTSIFNCLNGVYRPRSGLMRFRDRDLRGLRPHEIARLGVARVFQNIELFPQMTVADNLMLGRHGLMRAGLVFGALWIGPAQREEVRHRGRVEEIIDFLEMESIRSQPVGALPFGLQKRVQLGRALAMEPKLLLLDEPVAGMNLEETEDIARFVLDVKEELGVTQILVDHDMGVVLDIADRVIVLDFGRKIAEGTPDEIRRNPDVARAYLGQPLAAVAG
ncbi:MAG TPA: ABC transporter ATP-binding protein [Candidatus Limnocylindria bacterium]|jgi:branched-chain amino acid transport system ATP-binding protein|nr:ABC transporter ATP-binding protein [Candidatus Limnocylindria bacterium]